MQYQGRSILKYIFILSLVAIQLSAAPSVIGSRGLFLIEDAQSEESGVVAITSYLLFHKDPFSSYVGDVIAPHLLYSPFNFIDIFYSSGKIVTKTNFQFPQFWQTAFLTKKHDRIIGSKISLPIPFLKLGAKLTYSWPRDTSESASSIKETKGFGWVGLLALHFNDFSSALPNLILNYRQDQNTRYYGSGLEIVGSGGAILIEATSQEAKTDQIFSTIFDSFLLTPGLRINLSKHSYLSGGLSMKFTKNNPIQYGGVIGLTIGSALLKPPPPKIGILTGTITDANSGKSLQATISFPEKPKIKSVMSNEQNGVFKIMKIPAGLQVIEITAPGYQKITTAINIEANKVNAYDFKLKPLITYGTIAGNVYDANTRKPLSATINYNNKEIESDPITGAFKIEQVETGTKTIEVSKDGYFAQAKTVNVEENKVSQVDFALVSSVMRGYFIGRVVDKINSTPLAAKIIFPNNDIPEITTDSITGLFQTELPIGTYSIIISANDYINQSSLITIEKDKTTEIQIELNPTKTKTIFTGRVVDKQNATPLWATISFPEVGLETIYTDSVTGVFRIEIPIGSYLVEVRAPNYISQTALIVLEANKPLAKNFELVKSGMTITIKGIYFETGKATLKPESYATLQEAAKILIDNPNIKVEIQGHTDNTGSEDLNQKLSQARADAVMNYLVKNLGIAPERLTAKGYGSSQPIASNQTPEGRALNRRVNFKILE